MDQYEKKNSHLDFRVNVLFSDGGDVYPLFRSSREATNSINVLFYQFKTNGKTIGHYQFINDLDKFCQIRYKCEDGNYSTYSYYKGFRCPNCLSRFGGEKYLDKHLELCGLHKPQLLTMPIPGISNKTTFKRYGNMTLAPITIFFDFEATNVIKENSCDKCFCECDHKTKKYSLKNPFVIRW